MELLTLIEHRAGLYELINNVDFFCIFLVEMKHERSEDPLLSNNPSYESKYTTLAINKCG